MKYTTVRIFTDHQIQELKEAFIANTVHRLGFDTDNGDLFMEYQEGTGQLGEMKTKRIPAKTERGDD